MTAAAPFLSLSSSHLHSRSGLRSAAACDARPATPYPLSSMPAAARDAVTGGGSRGIPGKLTRNRRQTRDDDRSRSRSSSGGRKTRSTGRQTHAHTWNTHTHTHTTDGRHTYARQEGMGRARAEADSRGRRAPAPLPPLCYPRGRGSRCRPPLLSRDSLPNRMRCRGS